jgi:hypothetical protein
MFETSAPVRAGHYLVTCWSGGVYPTALRTSVGQTHFDTLPGPRRLCTTGLTCARLWAPQLAQLAELTGSPNPGWPSEINWFAQKLLCPKLWCSWSMTIEYYIHMLCWIIGFGCANFRDKPRHHRCEKNKKLKPRCFPGLSQNPGEHCLFYTSVHTHTSISSIHN